MTADRLGVYLPVEHIDNPKSVSRKRERARTYLHPTHLQRIQRKRRRCTKISPKTSSTCQSPRARGRPKHGHEGQNAEIKLVIACSSLGTLELHGYREQGMGHLHGTYPSDIPRMYRPRSPSSRTRRGRPLGSLSSYGIRSPYHGRPSRTQ